jgi:hypothetical protein
LESHGEPRKKGSQVEYQVKEEREKFIQPSGCIGLKERDGLFRPFLEGVMHNEVLIFLIINKYF